MKRYIALLLTLALTLSLAACGGTAQTNGSAAPRETPSAITPEPPQTTAPATTEPSGTPEPESTPEPETSEENTAQEFFIGKIKEALSEIELGDTVIAIQDYATDDTKLSVNLEGIKTAVTVLYDPGDTSENPILQSVQFVTTDENFWRGDAPFIAIRLVCEGRDEAVAVLYAMDDTARDTDKYEWPLRYKGYTFKDEEDVMFNMKTFFLEIVPTDEPDTFSIDGGLVSKK